jgi:hypothetical protein
MCTFLKLKREKKTHLVVILKKENIKSIKNLEELILHFPRRNNVNQKNQKEKIA